MTGHRITITSDLTYSMLVIFNLGRWLNSEQAWMLNTDNMGGRWTQAWHLRVEKKG